MAARTSKKTHSHLAVPLRMSPLERMHGPLPALRVADIVLVRHKKDATRSMLRRVTNSYWDHSALLIYDKNPARGYSNDVIIEAIQYGVQSSLRRGVEIHRLDKYLMRPDLYDVGIKRIEWLDENMRERVRTFVLMNVDTLYYPLYFTSFLLAWIFPFYRSILLVRQRYSCSSLVQKAFYEATDWDIRHKVVFGDASHTPIELQEVTSPADIAKSKTCTWIWNRH